MWSPKASPYAKSNSSCPLSLDRHRQHDAELARLPCDLGPELLVDENAGAFPREAFVERPDESGEDDPLGLGDARRLVGGRRAHDSEQLRLERAAVIECEQVDRVWISERQGRLLWASRTSLSRRTLRYIIPGDAVRRRTRMSAAFSRSQPSGDHGETRGRAPGCDGEGCDEFARTGYSTPLRLWETDAAKAPCNGGPSAVDNARSDSRPSRQRRLR